MAARFAILLRGVNVGGRNRLSMRDLVAALEAAGAREVQTLLQSGNALFSVASDADRVARCAMTALAGRAGFEPRFTVRSFAELARIARAHPLAARGRDPALLHVGFLAAKASAAGARALEGKAGPEESVIVKGSEVFIHYGKGVARSKLSTDLIDRALGTMCTMRNWNTVCALAALASHEG